MWIFDFRFLIFDFQVSALESALLALTCVAALNVPSFYRGFCARDSHGSKQKGGPCPPYLSSRADRMLPPCLANSDSAVCRSTLRRYMTMAVLALSSALCNRDRAVDRSTPVTLEISRAARSTSLLQAREFTSTIRFSY